jgi:diadenosine tetraphosphate (Ap4A) HIT family hydrolase
MGCELCEGGGGRVLWRDDFCRIVRPELEGYPAYCRVVLERHLPEMTDLDAGERERLMRAVYACEQALRELFRPDKVNLASLGNQVPHLHWHVIARYRDDPHYPDAIWAAPRRASTAARAAVADAALAARLKQLLGAPAARAGEERRP